MQRDVHVKFFDAEYEVLARIAEEQERSLNYVIRALVAEALKARADK